MLIERTTLESAGGLDAIRNALIDDCALARVIKPHGALHLALGESVESLRVYGRYADIRRMVVRSAYAQLRFSPWRLMFVVASMLLVFIAPVVVGLAGRGLAQGIALATWALMGLLFMPMLKRYRVPMWSGFALPAIAGVYLAFTVESAFQHLRGRGGLWKGRVNGPVVESSR